MQNIKTIPQLAVQNLPADLESKADADEVVLLTGNQTVEGNKNLTETPVIQLWNADINPTANQTIVFSINSVGTFELYKNKTGINGSNPPAQDGTNWEFVSTCQGSRAYVQEFAPSDSPVSSITLTEGICYNADFMTVAVDHTILDPSAYTLGINGTTITFAEPVEAGLTITVRWFTEMNLSNVYRQPLLSCFWSDHLIYELSYLCADPFSWQDGNVYSSVYNHLVADIEGKSIITEGLITYYLADDGHKIATAISHDAVANLYDETGVAWYYILDVENHRFKLPRTKYAFSGWRGNVGEYIPESLPNITGTITPLNNGQSSGAFTVASSGEEGTATHGANAYRQVTFDASRSSSAYQNGAPVQQRGTQMYLYFYVGNYTPQAIEQTAGYAQTLTELKADKNLINSPYTTNRILEIPQDINLELNDGTLTLKAGSKVYVPNGFEEDGTTPKFDVVTLSSDLTYTDPQPYDYKYVTLYYPTANAIGGFYEAVIFSGTTQPVGYPECVWYDTNNNVVKMTTDGFATWTQASLPIGIYQQSSSGITTAIDQIFNGFGYIGSTVFALPGVKVQIPNGKNEDGTYKFIEYTTESVQIENLSAWSGDFYGKLIFGDQFMIQPDVRFHTKTNGVLWTFKDNQWYIDVDGTVTKRYIMFVGNVHMSSGKVSSLNLYDVDSVANSNASNFSKAGRSYLSGLGMPSAKYIDLTPGANGSTYTAPANGWFSAYNYNVNYGFCALLNTTKKIGDCGTSSANITDGFTCVPVSSGDTVVLRYSGSFNTSNNGWFCFIYAEGEN